MKLYLFNILYLLFSQWICIKMCKTKTKLVYGICCDMIVVLQNLRVITQSNIAVLKLKRHKAH